MQSRGAVLLSTPTPQSDAPPLAKSSEVKEDSASTSTAPRFFRQYAVDLLVLLPTAAALLAAVQIYVFSSGDLTTFRFIVKTVDAQDLLLSTILPALLVLSFIAVFSSFAMWIGKPTPAKIWKYLTHPSALVHRLAPLSLAAALTTPLIMVGTVTQIIIAAVGSITWTLSVKEALRKKPAQEKSSTAALRVLGPTIAIIIVGSMFGGQSWLPPEMSELPGQTKPSLIYVLDIRDSQATILDMQEGRVKILPNNQVKTRQPCSIKGWPWRDQSIRQYVAKKRGVSVFEHPICPEVKS